jgi:hypothetical protein
LHQSGIAVNFGGATTKLIEETMNIKFVIKYSYLPHVEHDKFRAIITFRLPKEPCTDEVAYCYQVLFDKEKITGYSGYDAGEMRVIQRHFSDDVSFETLEKKIISAIEEYKKRVSENVRLAIEAMDKSGEIFVDFPDFVKVYD